MISYRWSLPETLLQTGAHGSYCYIQIPHIAWAINTLGQLYAYSQKGLEIISLVISVRLLPVRLEERRSRMNLYEISYLGCLLHPVCVFRFCIKSNKNIVNYMRRATCAYKIWLSNWLFFAWCTKCYVRNNWLSVRYFRFPSPCNCPCSSGMLRCVRC